MPNRKRDMINNKNAVNETLPPTANGWWSGQSTGNRWLIMGLVAFLCIGVMGAGLKYLEETAREEKIKQQKNPLAAKNQSLLSRVNPFMPPPAPAPTPQLSKEYIYAGSRLLAVEDAAANAVPPADLAVWRPSSGIWYVLGGTGSQGFATNWGNDSLGDVPTPGDFDGDGKTDLAILRRTTATWWIWPSSGSSAYTVSLGATCTPPADCDLPAQADFDGDGKTDPAVWRPSNGGWYIFQSSTQSSVSTQFGSSGDIPAPADYDGDGKADIAVWRSSNTTFYAVKSTDGNWLTPSFGSSGNIPVSGDYDGDGKANFALQTATSFVIVNSTLTATTSVSWGQSGDVAVQNDYDADGICDVAVWRPSTGVWIIRNSSNASTRTEQWGLTGDTPVPALYRR